MEKTKNNSLKCEYSYCHGVFKYKGFIIVIITALYN